ncbi:leucyl/phenylalanyl-tRNA--protein transferase [Gelidibacter salicanalis]|uniref:Leucyl/phenylalanyl-tRNA--protein transferase n=1 Tax=Gelidibacter salicanalis TaxID=291193 RepID=A0A5C7AM44_9FLAO|nr:leucyl/phenylalanyl-tRNA--protein transferase [Gelidibacter salicanalis]TXE09004.1 leucyl/phenylalanyl-tRNA--protein transferase [Gelidibacter salicanalis]
MVVLSNTLEFPDVSKATSEGLLAVGGDLSIERLLLAYKSGIFPWFDDDEVILWWSPNPRFVLFPEHLKVSKSMRQFLRNTDFSITINKAFREVITECSNAYRVGQAGTWITEEMIVSYTKLHQLGYATSVEVWQNDQLVGGLYGIDLGNGVFCGESMFAKVSNASKAAFITFIHNTNYKLIDCQVYTQHLESLGAEEIERDAFLKYL